MKRKTLNAILGATMIASLVGCGNTEKPVEQPDSQVETQQKTENTENTESEGTEKDTETDKESSADNKLNRMEKIDKVVAMADLVSSDTQNMLYSHTSLDMALGMVAEGSEGVTREQLDEYLGTDDYASKAKNYMEFAESISNETSQLEIANSVWVNKDHKLLDEYKLKVEDTFKAETDSLDFVGDANGSANTINEWIDNKTHGLIKEVVTPSSLSTAQNVLVNTVYFNSPWAKPWETKEDVKLTFNNLDGTTSEVDKIYGEVNCYFENEKATAFGKVYENGTMFIGILPKEEGNFKFEDLDISSLLESKTYEPRVYAEMMKLDYEYSIENIIPSLEALGVKDVFGGMNQITKTLESGEPLVISNILQKCKIMLDENKTEAAASTVIIEANGIMPVEREVKEVILDRPYAYMIYDTQNEEVLFIGKYINAN